MPEAGWQRLTFLAARSVWLHGSCLRGCDKCDAMMRGQPLHRNTFTSTRRQPPSAFYLQLTRSSQQVVVGNMFSAARMKLLANGAARVLPAAVAPKRALSSTRPLVNLFLSFVILQLLLLCADAHILPADQHVMGNAATEPKSILRVRAEYAS